MTNESLTRGLLHWRVVDYIVGLFDHLRRKQFANCLIVG